MIEGIDVPAIGRNLPDGIPPFAQKLPERFRIVVSSGKAAGHPDDCNRLSLRLLRRIEPRLQFLYLEIGLLDH